MKTRTLKDLITLAKKRYIVIALLLLVVSLSGIGAFICIVFQVNILTNHDSFVNNLLQIIWLICSMLILKKLTKFRKLFFEGELDWVFGENLPDDPNPEK